MRFDYKNRVLAKHKAARKERKQQRIQEVKNQDQANRDEGMSDGGSDDNKTKAHADLSKAQRKQIFKKSRAKEIKGQIAELKLQSKKLKKSNSAQKSEKKKIAKLIKELKAQVKRSGETAANANDESSDEDSE